MLHMINVGRLLVCIGTGHTECGNKVDDTEWTIKIVKVQL